MEAVQIVQTAFALDLDDTGSMIVYAQMLAEHCAQLAEECPQDASALDAAMAIRASFRLIART